MNKILIILIGLMFFGLMACFGAVYSTNLSVAAYQAHAAYLNKQIMDERLQRRVLQDRIWHLEWRHDGRLLKVEQQADILTAAYVRGNEYVVRKLATAGAFD